MAGLMFESMNSERMTLRKKCLCRDVENREGMNTCVTEVDGFRFSDGCYNSTSRILDRTVFNCVFLSCFTGRVNATYFIFAGIPPPSVRHSPLSLLG